MIIKIVLASLCFVILDAMEPKKTPQFEHQESTAQKHRIQLVHICNQALPIIRKFKPEHEECIRAMHTQLLDSEKASFELLSSFHEKLKVLIESLNPRSTRCGCRYYERKLLNPHPLRHEFEQRVKTHRELEALLQQICLDKK